MKRVLGVVVAVALTISSIAIAEDVKSGLEAGASIGAFQVTKCAGAEEDGVKTGENLCYRCKNSSRPQVMVFTRSTDDKVVAFVKDLDAQLKKHEEAQLRGFVNVLGESKDAASDEAKKLAKTSKAVNVPFVVPNEVENGPENYGINPKVEVTIIIANEGKVVANFASSAKELNSKAVFGKIKEMLN